MIGTTTRRAFVRQTVGTLLAAAVWSPAAIARAEAAGARPDRWLRAMQVLALRVKGDELRPLAWARRMRRLAAPMSVAAVRRWSRLSARAAAVRAGAGPEPQMQPALWPATGAGAFAYSSILSFVRQGRAVVPHAHTNMVSMHLVLQGAVRLRQYDRLADEPDAIHIRPLVDRVCRPGDTTAISDGRGNVHWFHALEDSFLLVFGVSDVDPAGGPAARQYVDPERGDVLSDGSIRAPILAPEDAFRRYLTT